MAISLTFRSLTVPGNSSSLPLSSLDLDMNCHIHGELLFVIDGRQVPYLGYFGPADVCFNTWMEELGKAITELGRDEQGSYTFDEGEQGQPAYLFERDGAHAYLSIIASESTGQTGDPEWQRIAFDFKRLGEEYERLRGELIATLRREAPEAADAWVRDWLLRSDE